jgi:hypothetical protein
MKNTDKTPRLELEYKRRASGQIHVPVALLITKESKLNLLFGEEAG